MEYLSNNQWILLLQSQHCFQWFLTEASGLDVVVDVSNTVYFKTALEITKDATTAYDKTYPAK